MKQAKTVRHKILNETKIFDETICLYNKALSYLIEVIDLEFTDLSLYSTKDMTNLVEGLVHATKKNPSPKYVDFDTKFYKFPSYFRRAVIATAFGKIKSFRSLYNNWFEEKKVVEESGRKFKKSPPTKQFVHKEFPILYKGNMFVQESETTGKVKAFVKNDWVWVNVRFRSQDLSKRGVKDWKENNPKLTRQGKKYFLSFSYEEKIPLNKTTVPKQRICAIDLGLTNTAVCSIMDAKGTILARKFIKQAREKDQLRILTNKLRKAQRKSGPIAAPHHWNRIQGLRKHMLNSASSQIVRFAKEHNADVIVFEFLGKMRVPKGFYGAKRLRFKLHYWNKIGLQNKVTEMAHYEGMRISRINPKNTSKFAFDGSGELKRNAKGDIATFANGKTYHADLSASYNIGARYFLRHYMESMSEKAGLSILAKVPELASRTETTLASLLAFHNAKKPSKRKVAK